MTGSLSSGQTHQDYVEQKGNHGIGKLGDHLGRAVVAGLDQFFGVHGEAGQMEFMLLVQEEDYPSQGRDDLPKASCQGGTANAQVKSDNQHIVHDSVDNACNHGEEKCQVRCSRSYQIILEHQADF